MKTHSCLAVLWLLAPVLVWSQQANVNLDYNPQKNAENLIPFSAALNSPDVRDDGTVTFRLRAPAAKGAAHRASSPRLEPATVPFTRATTASGR